MKIASIPIRPVCAILVLLAWAQPAAVYAEQPVVSFAGGAVNFRVPFDWSVSEIAQGRQIRLAIAPNTVKELDQMLHGVSVSLDYSPRGEQFADDHSDIQSRLDIKTRLLKTRPETTSFRAGSPDPIKISGLSTVRQSFTFTTRSGKQKDTTHQGVYVLARCGEAVFELRATSPEGESPSANEIAEQILRTLTLAAPNSGAKPTQNPTGSKVAAAEPLLGSWKALRSQFAFRGDGRVRLRFDQDKTWRLASGRPLETPQRIRQITGTFQAEGDVVTIRWDDGSRLNYRWRLSNGRLYLTDHLGRVSQLHRLYQ